MAITLGFYADAGLTTPLANIPITQASDGTSAAVDFVCYLGSTVTGQKFQDQASPGGNPIYVSVSDTNGTTGLIPAYVKLAATNGALAAATPGAPLTLATEILSGTTHSVAIHGRVDTPALSVGIYTDLRLETQTLIEVPV